MNQYMIMRSLEKLMCRIVIFLMLTVAACTSYGFARSIDLSMSLSTNGFSFYRFGNTAKSVLGKTFSPSLVPRAHGEEFILKGIRDRRFGFEYLHLGFTMESQRLCNIGLCRNFNYDSSDSDMLGVVSNVHLWVKSSFGDDVKLNPSFDLHSPPNALFSSVEKGSFRLQLKASHRTGPCWVMLSLSNSYLEEEASVEYDRLSKNETIRAEVERRKKAGAWLTPLYYALPLYLIFCIPFFLVLMAIYIMVMKARKQEPLRIIHWLDPVTLLVAPYAWGFFEHVGQSKSLSNLCEFVIIGWIWCFCMVVRYVRSVIGLEAYQRKYGYITFVIVILSAIMLAILFPTLPE